MTTKTTKKQQKTKNSTNIYTLNTTNKPPETQQTKKCKTPPKQNPPQKSCALDEIIYSLNFDKNPANEARELYSLQ